MAGEPIRFGCAQCGIALSDAVVKQRMRNPPGKCNRCGSPIVAQLEEGAAAELARAVGEPMGSITADRSAPGGFRIEIDGERVR